MTFAVRFEPGLKPVFKHGTHDQKKHGSWADGSGGTNTELSDDEIREVIYGSKTVEQMFQKIAKLQGKSMKPKVAELKDSEVNLYRGVANPKRDTQQLLEGKVPFTSGQTWGQGIYVTPLKDEAEGYGKVIGMKLDDSATLVRREDSAFDVDMSGDEFKSNFLDFPRIRQQVLAGKKDNMSVSDSYNIYWAGKGYDGYSPHGRETVLFNAEHLTLNSKDVSQDVKKHGTHDQSTHGSWADGSGGDVAPYELSSYYRANFDETDDYDEMVKVYTERYGEDSQNGVVESELRALNDYANHGYEDTNAYLRGTLEDRVALTPNESGAFASGNSAMRDIAFRDNPVVGESIESQTASHDRSIRIYEAKNRDSILTAFNAQKRYRLLQTVDQLDEIINDSPLHFRDTTLYRSMSSRGLSTLKVGDVVTDRGFMSTTRVDITDPKNMNVLASFSGLGSGAKRIVAVIYPDSSRSMGRGIAVDAIKLVSGDSTDVSTREKEVLLPRNTQLKFLGYGTPKMGDRTMETNGQVAVFKRQN